jgi:hypothetical protein
MAQGLSGSNPTRTIRSPNPAKTRPETSTRAARSLPAPSVVYRRDLETSARRSRCSAFAPGRTKSQINTAAENAGEQHPGRGGGERGERDAHRGKRRHEQRVRGRRDADLPGRAANLRRRCPRRVPKAPSRAELPFVARAPRSSRHKGKPRGSSTNLSSRPTRRSPTARDRSRLRRPKPRATRGASSATPSNSTASTKARRRRST